MKEKLLWLLFILIIVSDQLTKIAVLARFSEGEVLPVIPDVFNLTLVFNPGAAFGIFADLGDTYRRAAIFSVSLLALVVVFFLMRDVRGDRWSEGALAAVLGGAIGNIIDRFRFDAVVDFLDLYYESYHWPAFNVADSAISIGVTVLIVRMLFFAPAEKPTAEASM